MSKIKVVEAHRYIEQLCSANGCVDGTITIEKMGATLEIKCSVCNGTGIETVDQLKLVNKNIVNDQYFGCSSTLATIALIIFCASAVDYLFYSHEIALVIVVAVFTIGFLIASRWLFKEIDDIDILLSLRKTLKKNRSTRRLVDESEDLGNSALEDDYQDDHQYMETVEEQGSSSSTS